MEAHVVRAAILAAAAVSLGASYRTPNFIVEARSSQFARQVGDAAETYRRELAKIWVGRELRNWASPCPIRVRDGARLGAGGMTSFVFDRGEVFGWQMSIQGSRERILDSVLPHEVTHTIFASYFRRPLPRWADEGACTTMEHASERAKQNKMLIRFLKSGHGIPFSRMLVMKDYPRDVLPLYSQGYSLARFLIEQGNRSKFLQFVKNGMENDRWAAAVREHYGYSNLSELQNAWLDWVKQGSPKRRPSETDAAGDVIALATNRIQKRAPSRQGLIYRAQSEDSPVAPASSVVPRKVKQQHEIAQSTAAMENERPAVDGVTLARRSARGRQSAEPQRLEDHDGRMSPATRTYPQATPRNQTLDSSTSAGLARAEAVTSTPTRTQLTRPQPIQKSRQIILEWSRPSSMPLAPGSRGIPLTESERRGPASADATAHRLVPIRR